MKLWKKPGSADDERRRTNAATARKTQVAARDYVRCTPCGGTGKIDGEIHSDCWGAGEVLKRR